MSGWIIFLIFYIIILPIAIGGAFLYRKYTREKDKAQFDEFMKLRAFLYAQIDILIKAYDELFEEDEEESSEQGEEPHFEDTMTLVRDVETNLIVLKTELVGLEVAKDLQEAKSYLIKIINRLDKHLFVMLGAKKTDEVISVIGDANFKKNTADFRVVNRAIKDFIEKRGLSKEDYFYQGKQLYI